MHCTVVMQRHEVESDRYDKLRNITLEAKKVSSENSWSGVGAGGRKGRTHSREGCLRGWMRVKMCLTWYGHGFCHNSAVWCGWVVVALEGVEMVLLPDYLNFQISPVYFCIPVVCVSSGSLAHHLPLMYRLPLTLWRLYHLIYLSRWIQYHV